MNPYENLPPEASWRAAVADKKPHEIGSVWTPKFKLNKKHNVVTAGSCFAQHISSALVAQGYAWLDGEPAPKGLSLKSQQEFNYGAFSFRIGDIYTAALLRQWLEWALADKPVPDEIWLGGGRFYDPFRPAIEPEGFSGIEEVQASRKKTLNAIREVFAQAKVFIFTLGSTEAWINNDHDCVYPMCPGMLAGEFDASKHQLVNYTHPQISRDLREAFNLIKKTNPGIKFILTVSPAPLTATATDKHVLVANSYSKSTLRSMAGELASARADVDYFPSYELITGSPFRSMFFEENLMDVTPEGVNFMTDSFFSSLGEAKTKHKPIETAPGLLETLCATGNNETDVIGTQQIRLLPLEESIAVVDGFIARSKAQNPLKGQNQNNPKLKAGAKRIPQIVRQKLDRMVANKFRLSDTGSTATVSQQIPRVVFQYWDQKPPNEIITLIDRNRFLCATNNIEHRLFDDTSARNLIKSYFSDDVYRAYDLSPHPAMKCDLFRLCYLYQYGGFYLDADMVFTENMTQLFALDTGLVVFKWDTKNKITILNGVIGSEPGSEIIRFIIQSATISMLNAYKQNPHKAVKNTLGICGPVLFTRAIGTFIAQNENQAELFITVERVQNMFKHWVNNGPAFLKKPLEYKNTELHWAFAAKRIQ